jgi:septum formation protein
VAASVPVYILMLMTHSSMSAPLILASLSPRRRELLSEHGVEFEVVPSHVPETPLAGESPRQFARRAAQEKASEVARRYPGRFVLGADTVVVLDGAIFGKPTDRDDARRMLRSLSGRRHAVLTAVALLHPTGRVEEVIVETEVEFRVLADEEIEEYIEKGEPFDKAGAYAIQGWAGKFVRAVRGSYSNVIGLPIDEVTTLLQAHVPVQARASE